MAPRRWSGGIPKDLTEGSPGDRNSTRHFTPTISTRLCKAQPQIPSVARVERTVGSCCDTVSPCWGQCEPGSTKISITKLKCSTPPVPFLSNLLSQIPTVPSCHNCRSLGPPHPLADWLLTLLQFFLCSGVSPKWFTEPVGSMAIPVQVCLTRSYIQLTPYQWPKFKALSSWTWWMFRSTCAKLIPRVSCWGWRNWIQP